MDLKEAKEIINNTPYEFNMAQPRVLYFEAQRFIEGYEAGIKEAAEIANKAGREGKDWIKHEILSLLKPKEEKTK